MDLWNRIFHKPRTIPAREWLFQIHLWLGIISGIYAIAIGISGSALMFRQEINDARHAQYESVTPPGGRAFTPPDQWLDAIRKSASPPNGIVNLEFPKSPQHAVKAVIYRRGGPQHFYVNPYTAEVTAQFNEGGVMRWIDQFHSNFFLGRNGRLINGIGGLCLLTLALTGIFLWWPGPTLFKRRLTIDTRASWKRINFDLHHAIGFWCLAGFSIISLSGAYFTWPQVFRQTIDRFAAVTPQQQPPRIAPRPGTPRTTLVQMIAAADQAFPHRPVVRAAVPLDGPQPVRLVKAGDGLPFHRTATSILLNPFTAEVLRVERYDQKTTGDRILAWIGPLHAGNFGGLPIQLLWFVLGLTMPTLFITGFLMWWLRVIRKRIVSTMEIDYAEREKPDPVTR